MSGRMIHRARPYRSTSMLVLGLAAALGGCAGLPEYSGGPLQPQAVAGPCRAESFFLLAFRSVPADLTVAPSGEACTLTLVNPALNRVINAALITRPAAHGRATAGLTSGSRQAIVSYQPAPGFVGRDTFDVTLQPNAVGITFNVTVGPGQ